MYFWLRVLLVVLKQNKTTFLKSKKVPCYAPMPSQEDYYNLSWIYTCTALLNFPRHYLPDVHVRTKKSNSWIWIWCDELLCLICILFIMWETIKMGTVELQSLSQEHVALVQIVQDANALTLITTDFYFHDYNRKYNIMCKNVIKC